MTEKDDNGAIKKFHPDCYTHKCVKCSRQIIDDCVVGFGSYYHGSCFTCVNCNKKLEGDFVDKGKGMPYCYECGTPKEVQDKTCARCSVSIDPFKDTVIICEDRIWHKDCLSCSKCSKVLADSTTNRKISCVETFGGNIMCDPCYYGDKGRPDGSGLNVCNHCNQPLVGRFVSTGNEKLHPECFVCSSCGNKLTGQFYNSDGKKICQNCSSKCFVCFKPFSGPHVICRNRKYHKECFSCDKCGVKLSEDYYVVDDKPRCEKCGALR